MRLYKRILASVGIVLLCTALVLLMLVSLARSGRVQTATLRVFSEQMSRGLGAKVEVGHIAYKFPNRLIVEDVLIEDRQRDTLLYIDTLSAYADMLKLLREDTLCIHEVALVGGYLNAYPVNDSTMNYLFLVDAFRSEKQDSNSDFHINLQVQDIRLTNIRARLNNWRGQIPDAALHVYNITPHLFDVEIERLSANVRHRDVPFDLLSLQAHLLINDTLVTFPTLHATLPSSNLQVEQFVINRADAKRLRESLPKDSITRAAILSKTAVNVRIEEATFTPYDFSAFVPRLSTMRQPWALSADIHGRIDSIQMHQLQLSYRNQSLLSGDVTAFGLPYADRLYLKAQCRDFHINKAILQDILSSVRDAPFNLPPVVARLGDIHYKGAIEGTSENMVLKGAFTTALGSIRTDGRAILNIRDSADIDRTITDINGLRFNGTVSTKRFNLGRALNRKDLGTVSLTVTTNFSVVEDKPFNGDVCLNLNHITFRQYTYRNLHLDGTFKNKIFTGQMHSDDDNLGFAFSGSIDLNESSPNYDFHFNLLHFRPGPLHLSDKYADSDMHLRLDVKLSGSNIDNIEGYASLQNFYFYHASGKSPGTSSLTGLSPDSIVISELNIKQELQKRKRLLRIDCDYLNASFSGEYLYSTLLTSAKKAIYRQLPSIVSKKELAQTLRTETNNEIDFYIYARDLDRIFRVLELPYTIAQKPIIKGHLYDHSGELMLQAVVPDIQTESQHIENLTISADNLSQRLNLSVFAMKHHGTTPASQKLGDMHLYLNARAQNDSMQLFAGWNKQSTKEQGTRNKDEGGSETSSAHNGGELKLLTAFSRYADKPLITAEFLHSDIILSDSLWTLYPSRITYCAADTTISVEQFLFASGSKGSEAFSTESPEQYIYLNGIASTAEKDTIYAQLQSIDLDYFLGVLTDVHRAIYFGGNVTGWIKAYGILGKPMFEAEVAMEHAHINNGELGNLFASATLDSLHHVIIKGDVYDPRVDSSQWTVNPLQEPGKHVVHVDGVVGGPNAYWGLDIYPDSVDLTFISYWCQNFLTDIDGRGTGKLRVWGMRDPVSHLPGTWVKLAAKPFNAGITVPFTGGRYIINDSILMDSTSLSFPKMVVHDTEGNPATLEGVVVHDGSWRDIKYNLDIEAQHAIVLNIEQTTEQMYGGKIYANGTVNIHGDMTDCYITADATTTSRSTFWLSTSDARSANDNNFIEFVNHNSGERLRTFSLNESGVQTQHSVSGTSSRSSTHLDLQVEVTPQTDVSVLLNRHTGDQLRGRGNGNLKLTTNDADMSIFGTYTLQQGTFNFTFQNVIRREFKIDEGSSITWSGAPDAPEIDIRAYYRLTASLRDLFGTETSSLTNRGSVPVNCVLNLSDRLSNPVIRFGVELPSSDESVASQVKAVINTDEMLMRQVLYLLVFNKFYSPEYLQNTNNVGLNETYSILSSTVTGQINSWLSRVTDVVNLGFNFRTDGEGSDASQEYEAQFEIHPVRGLLINGNFGYRYNDISNQPVFGNLDIEYMLTQDGKVRAKAYTHTVDKYSLRQANTVQGVGFVFKHEFNWRGKR